MPPASADVALHGLDGWLTLAFHTIAVGGQRCAATDSSRRGSQGRGKVFYVGGAVCVCVGGGSISAYKYYAK